MVDKAATNKRLAVITVTYNSADVLPGFLDSLAEGLSGIENAEVIVADNASTDASADLAHAHPIRPQVIRTGRNGGYSAGINAAIATVSAGSDLLILNPDIRLMPGAARALVDRLADPSVGIVAPQILSEQGEIVRSLRREPSVLTAWSDALLGGRLGAGLGTGEVVADEALYRLGGPVEWASGAALGISARALEQVGDWDETFFLYSEETDYCRRVRDHGFEIVYVPQAKTIHIGGDYMVNPYLYAILTANRIRYYRRNHSSAATALFQIAVAFGEGVRALLGVRYSSGLRAALAPDRWMSLPPP
jgi:GT2 family glycosyltransferase